MIFSFEKVQPNRPDKLGSDGMLLKQQVGGKAFHLASLSNLNHEAGIVVPAWIALSTEIHEAFLREIGGGGAGDLQAERALAPTTEAEFEALERRWMAAPFPKAFVEPVREALQRAGLLGGTHGAEWVAVRSSAVGEDSAQNSFAGQFSSFLYQRGWEQIERSIKRVWASAYSLRAASYRQTRGVSGSVRMGVVIQKMVQAESAGVAFSRHPVRLTDRSQLLISSVWGVGEGLVSGELEADHFEINRDDLTGAIHSQVAAKQEKVVRVGGEAVGATSSTTEGGGICKVALEPALREAPSLSAEQVRQVARLALAAEKHFGCAQDVEWAFENGKLYCLQSRPITGLPPDAHFDSKINGETPILWDNSNIIESYCGVTSPLTFSHISRSYAEVYDQFCRVMGVPEPLIAASEGVFRNMLGLVRGRVYYNLMNWYRLIFLFPGAAASQSFMETMMGVKQSVGQGAEPSAGQAQTPTRVAGKAPDYSSLFEFLKNPPRYSLGKKIYLIGLSLYRYFFIAGTIRSFQQRLEKICEPLERDGFKHLSFSQQVGVYRMLEEELLKKWDAPIINDGRCMVAFGFLKALTQKWLKSPPTAGQAQEQDPAANDPTLELQTLQNDLLCGEGDLKSTEPTKLLMRLAARLDQGPQEVRQRFLEGTSTQLWQKLQAGEFPQEITQGFRDFLAKYGFRCVNELKLEEPDLHDDPSFVLESVRNYLRVKSYDVAAMERREREIRAAAERKVRAQLSGIKRWFYFFILRWARRAVSDRENLRFDRTRIFGITRHLFRAMGERLVALQVLEKAEDIFYLTIDEILAFQEGRATLLALGPVAALRRAEFDEYRKTPAPPDRFLTHGAAGSQFRFASLLLEADLLTVENQVLDPSRLKGTPCCPGVVEGVVRVARTIQDAEALNGEILVTERTDPGWVPLYPSCSGLLIERGSLLSHSAVVARELGLPTIVGISGGLMKRLKTGDRVRIDAARGEVTIL